jgi:hypothetical protein
VHADPSAPDFSVLNATVDAGAALFQAGSNAFPNFNSGAFDNFYPLAHAHLDSSPFTEATGSPADTGPIGAYVASGGYQAGAPAFPQPQYADDRFPPGNAGGAPSTVGQAPGPNATALAVADKASVEAGAANVSLAATGAATGTAAGTGSALPATKPAADPWAALWRALSAWRQIYLTADAATRFPAAREDASADGIQGLTSNASTTFDPTAGVLTGVGEAHAAFASFGSGAVTLNGVHVQVSITNDGNSIMKTVTDDVANAAVDGVPVEIGPNGVSVNGQQVPGIADQLQSADAALNSALATGGLALTALAPTVTSSTGQLVVEASGVQVAFNQPPVPQQLAGTPLGGLPQQQMRVAIGDVFVDDLAVPAVALTLTPTESSGSGAALSTTPVAVGPNAGSGPNAPSALPSAGTTRSHPELVALITHKPGWLLALYLVWQVILLATLGSLWWWRKAPGVT